MGKRGVIHGGEAHTVSRIAPLHLWVINLTQEVASVGRPPTSREQRTTTSLTKPAGLKRFGRTETFRAPMD